MIKFLVTYMDILINIFVRIRPGPLWSFHRLPSIRMVYSEAWILGSLPSIYLNFCLNISKMNPDLKYHSATSSVSILFLFQHILETWYLLGSSYQIKSS